ncbi:DUF2076 domain-containing protein [Martelella alba]|uniref:DUF2076 domain-containing protein n=1 Tax=Martelella alba TaxID=2590451 RepID=A0ABY2SL15_9HYPH|nr:DUF2076 domain-containing protein [Martelella alba]TKI06331.1 DUF2076 domain-containing protein [Martelella alba]
MQSEEQRLIEGLFQRLKQAEQQNGARDADADRQIREFVQQQPSAPYYMAQSMLIQEAALKRLHARIRNLEEEMTTLKNSQPSSGGFLSSLFGGGKNSRPAPGNHWNAPAQPAQPVAPGNTGYAQTPPGYTGYAQQPAAPRGGGFMAGALQTAAGVAGGVVLADMLTSMFHHSQPQDIVNIIDQQPMDPAADPLTNQNFDADNLSTFNDVSDSRFLDQNNDDSGNTDYDNGDDNGFGNADNFGNDGFGNDNFGNDGFGNDNFGNDGFGNDGFGNDDFGNDDFGNDDDSYI